MRQKIGIMFFLVVGILLVFASVFAYMTIFHLYPEAAVHLQQDNVRKPVVAGTFYPADRGNLKILVKSFLSNSVDMNLGDVHAVVVPHAGYVYSGQVAAEGFRQLESRKDSVKKVFIIGNNHASGVFFEGISVANFTHFETPLGRVAVSPIAKELSARKPFASVQAAQASHVIEVELPFLQNLLGDDFEIIPLVVGAVNQGMINDAARLIDEYFDGSSLLVVSSDLSHYHPYDDAVALDTDCIGKIENQSFAGVASCEACGREAILVLLRVSEMNGWKAEVVDYKNSGDSSGDKSSVVGYSSVAFFTEPSQFDAEVVNEQDQGVLLDLARDTVEMYVREKKTPDIDDYELSPELRQVRGCFVTLNKDGSLRGCIGHIIPQKQLFECVVENAVNAATADPRFTPVSSDELDDIDVEISVLTLPAGISYSSPDDLLSKLRPGVDGVVLQSGFRASTFLPQVWEMFDSKQAFMESLCKKQGSAADCWKSADVSVYQAQVFAEKK